METRERSRSGLGSCRWTPPTSPSRLLLAHPDHRTRLELIGGLRSGGWTIHEFADAGELLEWIAGDVIDNGGPGPTDLIIMDARLPGRKGVRLLSDLRRANWSTPVVLLAETGMSDLAVKAHVFGNALVFEAPFEMYDLHTAVGYLLDRAAAGRGVPA